jgi:hypothetical protein
MLRALVAIIVRSSVTINAVGVTARGFASLLVVVVLAVLLIKSIV